MPAAAKPEFIRRQYEFAAHIRDPDSKPRPEDVEERRMAIYRELFYNNVQGFLSNGFPVLRRLLDDEAWHALTRDFLVRHRCHSPLFLEIPHEFLNYLEKERGEQQGDFPFMQELAHYEWVELALSVADADEKGHMDENDDVLDSPLRVSSLAWPLSYQYPVHQISPDYLPGTPGEQPTYLLAYRDQKDEVSFIELNPVSARLFALLQENPSCTGRQVLDQIVSELQHPNPKAVIDGGRRILEQWRQRAIVLRGVVT